MKNAPQPKLPNLIIIGAHKCGTTSLHRYLGLHPEIFMSKEKELHFFVQERNWNKGLDWYRSQFISDAKVCGEASPSYTCFPIFDGVPARMHDVVPDAKLIYLVRDPIERIISHYIHTSSSGEYNRLLSDALTPIEENPYVYRSRYYMQLEQYLSHFPPSRILVVAMEELVRHPQRLMSKIFRFIGVNDTFWSQKFGIIHHPSSEKRRKTRAGVILSKCRLMDLVELLPPSLCRRNLREGVKRLLFFPLSHQVRRPVLDGNLRQCLIEVLQEDVNRLRSFTGNEFKDWLNARPG